MSNYEDVMARTLLRALLLRLGEPLVFTKDELRAANKLQKEIKISFDEDSTFVEFVK